MSPAGQSPAPGPGVLRPLPREDEGGGVLVTGLQTRSACALPCGKEGITPVQLHVSYLTPGQTCLFIYKLSTRTMLLCHVQ